MTSPRSADGESGDGDEDMTLAEFDSALERVVAEARDADVPLEGAYDVRSPRRDAADYTIEVSLLRKNRPSERD